MAQIDPSKKPNPAVAAAANFCCFGILGYFLAGQQKKAIMVLIPIIVLSTREDPIVKQQAFAGGANDYLVKLPDKLELVGLVAQHLRLFHLGADVADIHPQNP